MTTTPHAHATATSKPPLHFGIILLSLAMGGFAIGTTEFASMSLLPFFAADFRVDEPAAGYAISAYALGVVLGLHSSRSLVRGLRGARNCWH